MKTGLHLKLMLIMLLLIISLMTVVGAFLINGVMSFYLNDFYDQMQSVFSNEEFVGDLRKEAAAESGAQRLGDILAAHSGALGIDAGQRNYYVLDGRSGEFLVGSDEESGRALEMTPNILTALAGSEGYASSSTAEYMDVALPIDGGENGFIIYIRDNKATVSMLNSELFMIILEALIIGLVISVLLSFLLSKTIVTNIQRLTEGAQRLADGDFTEQIEVAADDEIGILTEAFNNMAGQLSDTLEAVEAERGKLNTLFLYMADGVVAFESDGSLMHCNPAAARLLDCGSQPDYEQTFAPLIGFEEACGQSAGEFFLTEVSRGESELQISIAPLPGERAARGVLAVVHDITEQKQNERLQREFVANVSHEMRTPLTSIRSYAETLNESEVPEEMRKKFLGVIINESDRMTRIVQDLLTLSRMDAGSTPFNMQPVSLAKLAENARDAMALEAQRHGHELRLELDRELPAVSGDASRLEQVIVNIVSNAVKYTPDGGHIVISGGLAGQEVYLSVEDDGAGIPYEDQPRVFERFYRVDKARSRESGGTGLGLAIAAEIVRRHNGRIELDSEPGRGTRMTVLLPAEGGDADA